MKKYLLSIICTLLPIFASAQEPYAVMIDGNTAIEFRYDNEKAARGGMDIGPFLGIEDRPWHDMASGIYSVVFDESFANCTSITSTVMWFAGFSNLETIIGIENLNTSNVTDMQAMFNGCRKLTNLDLTYFNTSKVINMATMFTGCRLLESINLSKFDTSNVTTMLMMFSDCESLKSLDVSHFNTSNVETMDYMFLNCSSLTSLDVSHFNTSKVYNFFGMFYGCSGLTSLNLRSFNTSNATDMLHMFQGSSNLKTIYVGDGWSTASLDEGWGNEMFVGCTSLVGGAGTTYDSSHTDASYAHIDGGSSNPGYLTGEGGGSGEEAQYWMELQSMLQYADELYGRARDNSNVEPWMLEELSMMINRGSDMYDEHTAEEEEVHHMIEELNWICMEIEEAMNRQSSETVVVNLINNSDMEGIDNSNFYYRFLPESTEASPQAISNGVGVNGSRGIKIEASANQNEVYNDEFWFHLNQPVSEGTRFKLTFDYRADHEARVYLAAHGPAFFGDFIWDWTEPYVYFSSEWQTYTLEGTIGSTVSSDQKPVASLSFSLNETPEANVYYFDNVKFEVFLDEQCPKPTFTQKQNENTVSIQSPFDATIYYTLDGSTPTTNSEHAFGKKELSFSQNTTIKAFAVVDGYETSAVATYSFEPTSGSNLDQRRAELLDMIEQLKQQADVCHMLLDQKDPQRTSDLWNQLANIEVYIMDVRDRTERAESDAELDECEDMIQRISEDLAWLRMKIDDYEIVEGEAYFDGLTAWVYGDATLDDAFAEVGRESAVQTIAAIVWEGTGALTAEQMQGITNPNLLVYVTEASKAPAGVQNVIVNGTAAQIVLTDASGNNNFFCPEPFTAQNISYTRNFSQTTEIGVSRGWETIALPFTVQSITHESHGVLEPFGINNGYPFWLRQLGSDGLARATVLEANVPFLICMPNNSVYPSVYNQVGNVTFSSSNVTVPETHPLEMFGANVILTPAFQNQAAGSDIFTLNVGEAQGSYPEGSVFISNYRSVRPFQCYARHSNQARGTDDIQFIPLTSIGGGDDTTAIMEIIQPAANGTGDWYSLDGRKLSAKPTQKGVYIQNGKKIVIK